MTEMLQYEAELIVQVRAESKRIAHSAIDKLDNDALRDHVVKQIGNPLPVRLSDLHIQVAVTLTFTRKEDEFDMSVA